MNNRVALVEPPSGFPVMRDMYSSTISKLGYSWPNVDLLTISGQLRKDFVCQIFDFSSNQVKKDECIKILKEFKPNHVIFAYGESTGATDLLFAQIVKSNILMEGAKILGTGGSLLHNPKKFFNQNDWLDGIILNYSYSSIGEYLKGHDEVMNLSINPTKANSCLFKKENPKQHYDIPPGLHQQLNLDSYYLPQFGRNNFTSISTSWGCPYKCSFCVSSTLNYRVRSAASIFKEIEYCKGIGIKTFFFRDNVFGVNKTQVKELSKMLTSSNSRISFMSDTRLDLITDDLISDFKLMGHAALNFGIETERVETREKFLKGLKTTNIHQTLKKCRDNNIITTGYFILGLEGEEEVDVKNTIDYSISLPLNYASFNLPIPIEGTKLRADAISRNLIKAESYNYDGSGSSFIPNEKIDDIKLKKLQVMAYKLFYFRASIVYKIFMMNFGFKPFKKILMAALFLKNWRN